MLGCVETLSVFTGGGSHLGPQELAWCWGMPALRSMMKSALTSSLSREEDVTWAWGKVDQGSVAIFLILLNASFLILCFTQVL